jgi:hypothetical protein
VIAAADLAAVKAVAAAWLSWYDALVFTPASSSMDGGPPAWVNERLEYAFSASSADGLTLAAAEYTDGRLDWHTFTTTPATSTTGRTTLGPLTVVPTPVTYPGMPASRLWEFEDGQVNFGALEAGPDDLGRMLLAGFALVYGANWMLLPLEVPTGSVVRITGLDVRDTFGTTTTIGPTDPTGAWNMFGLSHPDGSLEAALLAAPAVTAALSGRDMENVLLLRDEAANLAWAVEKAVEGADGARIAPAPPGAAADPRPYRLRTDPPSYWFPLLPQRAHPTDPSMTFRLGRLPDTAGPRGHLLHGLSRPAPVLVPEDEIPREGARLTRGYQLARWIDGTTFLWCGRRKGVGRGEGSSGLRFDVTDPS